GAAPQERALVHCGEVAGAPTWGAALGYALRLRHHAVGGQVVAGATEAIRHPGPEARGAHERSAAVELVHGRGGNRARTPARAEKGDVIDARRQVRHEVGHVEAALSVASEFASAGQERRVALGELADRLSKALG